MQYLEAWLGGNGCVPLHNLMEDAATAEIRWGLAVRAGIVVKYQRLDGALLVRTLLPYDHVCCASVLIMAQANLHSPPSPSACSRASVWQWVRYGVRLDDGQPLTADRVCMEVQRELDELRQQVGLCCLSSCSHVHAGHTCA